MKLSSMEYLFKQGLKNVWHNRIMALTSVGILSVCLIMVGVAMLVTMNVNNMVGYMEDQNEVVVFLEDIEQPQIDQVESELKGNANIASVEFISKEQGLAEQKERLGANGDLLDGFEGDNNVLPDAFKVKIKDLSKFKITTAQIQKTQGVESISASGDVASTLTDVKKIVNTFGYTVIAALGVISLVIITNTIKSTIFARRKEINIMKYVGATNLFIRIPFVVEGVALGVISALIAYLCIWGGYYWFADSFLTAQASPWLTQALQSIVEWQTVAGQIMGFFLAAGVVIGVAGSVLSVRKYAKV